MCPERRRRRESYFARPGIQQQQLTRDRRTPLPRAASPRPTQPRYQHPRATRFRSTARTRSVQRDLEDINGSLCVPGVDHVTSSSKKREAILSDVNPDRSAAADMRLDAIQHDLSDFETIVDNKDKQEVPVIEQKILAQMGMVSRRTGQLRRPRHAQVLRRHGDSKERRLRGADRGPGSGPDDLVREEHSR